MGTHLDVKGNHKSPYMRGVDGYLTIEEKSNVMIGIRCCVAGFEDGGRSHQPRDGGCL